MAVPDSRAHGYHRAAVDRASSNVTATEAKYGAGVAQDPPTVGDIPVSTDDDADISDSDEDSEDDSGSDDSDESREDDAGSTTVQHKTPNRGEPVAQPSFLDYAHGARPERKSSKRSAEEDIRPEYNQSTLKKRKALQDISGSNSRINIQTNTFEPPEAKPARTPGKTVQIATAAPVKAIQQKPRAVSTSSLLRASKSGNNWPRMQDSTEFSGATLADQRMELNSYRKDLFGYVDMIQAGAIPVQFVKSFLGRLDVHIEQMDKALQAVERLHTKEKKRQLKISSLHQEAMKDHEEAEHLLTNLTLPATYDG